MVIFSSFNASPRPLGKGQADEMSAYQQMHRWILEEACAFFRIYYPVDFGGGGAITGYQFFQVS